MEKEIQSVLPQVKFAPGNGKPNRDKSKMVVQIVDGGEIEVRNKKGQSVILVTSDNGSYYIKSSSINGRII